MTYDESGVSRGQLRLAGAVAALVSGAVVLFLARTTDAASPIAALPVLNVLGLGVATAFGAGLARRATGERTVLLEAQARELRLAGRRLTEGVIRLVSAGTGDVVVPVG